MRMVSSDSIDRVPYKIGESFRNPGILAPVTEAYRPIFQMRWLSKGPTQVKAEMWKSGVYRRYPTVWRRAAKSELVERLGERFSEVSGFGELPKGNSPTSQSTSVERSWWGSLTNSIVNVASTVLKTQGEIELAKAQAAQPQYSFNAGLPYEISRKSENVGWVGIGLMALGVGTIVYFFSKR